MKWVNKSNACGDLKLTQIVIIPSIPYNMSKCYSRVFTQRHGGHVGVHNNSEKILLGIWFYYYATLERHFAFVLYTNMAVLSREWKPRIFDSVDWLTCGWVRLRGENCLGVEKTGTNNHWTNSDPLLFLHEASMSLRLQTVKNSCFIFRLSLPSLIYSSIRIAFRR